MYFEQGSGNKRENWLFKYTGGQLLEAAERLAGEFRKKELQAREEVSRLISDPNISRDDIRIHRIKDDIEKYGRDYEACKVFAHEFRRNRDADFSLALGDVVYFGLCDGE